MFSALTCAYFERNKATSDMFKFFNCSFPFERTFVMHVQIRLGVRHTLSVTFLSMLRLDERAARLKSVVSDCCGL